MNRAPRKLPPGLEPLETRAVPATFGLPWPDASRLTVSFAPDGTDAGGQPSGLFERLNQLMPAATWQREVLRAFQAWAVHADINFAPWSDNGRPFGDSAPVEGHAGFGDIRLGARPLTTPTLGTAMPFDQGDTWAGDVLLNSAKWEPGSGHDLFTVMLQEAGHILGLPNSTDPASAMYDRYTGPRSGPTAADVAALQGLYGARTPDRFEGSQGNGELARASAIQFATSHADDIDDGDIDEHTPKVAHGDLATASDVDFYKVTVPAGATGLDVALRTSGLSLLEAKVTVFDAAGNALVGERLAAEGNDVVLRLQNLAPGGYFIKVEAASPTVFGVGSYRLAAGSQAQGAVRERSTGWLSTEVGTNETISTAKKLSRVERAAGPIADAVVRKSIKGPADVDVYWITAPSAAAGTALSLSVVSWALDVNKLTPKVTVYDKNGGEFTGQLRLNDATGMSVQMNGVVPGEKYYVKVAPADPASATQEGNYLLAVDFRIGQLQSDLTATGTLSASARQEFRKLTVRESQPFRFDLTSLGGVGVGVRLSLYNAAGQVVYTLASVDGKKAIGGLWLEAGTYVLRVSASTRDGSALAATGYKLGATGRGDTVGLETESTVDKPVELSGGVTTVPPGYYTTTGGLDFYLLTGIDFLGATDLYGSAFWS